MEQTYEPRQIDLTLYISDSNPNILKLISRWLGSVGTFELYISTEPYKVYHAIIEQALNPSIYNVKQGILDVTFTCYDPFGYSGFTSLELENNVLYNTGLLYNTSIPYYDSGIMKYTFVGADLPNLDIYHGGNADYAMPIITITGSGTAITIGRYSDSARTNLVQQCAYGSFSGVLKIDSKIRETFLNSVINNSSFTGDYFTLKGIGDTAYITAGDASFVTQSSIVLDANASSVDDFYNGKVLILEETLTGKVFYKTIVDYVGSSKTLSFSTTSGINVNSDYRYMIYDFINELNYFKITGTGLSITSVTFDFEYTYL